MSQSLRFQLVQFYRHCPEGDCLTTEDVAEKYDVDISHAFRVLKQMVSDGLLETTMVPSRRRVREVVAYRAVSVTVEAM